MRGRKKGTDLEALEAGLGAAEDPYLIKDLVTRPTAELVDEVRKEIRYCALSMLRAGRIFMAIKQQLAHGEWESFIDKQHWNRDYVRACMRFIEVAVKHPEAMRLPDGRTIKQLLRLPAPSIEAILTELPADAIEKLTPWDLASIYTKKKLAKSRSGAVKSAQRDHASQDGENLKARMTSPVDERIDDQLKDDDFKSLLIKHEAARDALSKLRDVPIKPEWHERIIELGLVKKLGSIFGDIVEKFHPVEELMKHADEVRAPGFTN